MPGEQGNVNAAIEAYEEKYGKLPEDVNALLVFTARKQAGVPVRLTKTKHSKLIEKTLKKRKAGGGASAAGGAGKKKPAKKKPAAPAEEEEAAPEEPAAPKKKAPKQEYPLESIVLLAGDRIGVVRWYGMIPSRKSHYFYGVEMLGPVAGSSDGMVDGVRYFQTAKDRAKFFPGSKIRKIASDKDQARILGHERSESWLARNASELAASELATADPDLPPVNETAEEAKDEAPQQQEPSEDGGGLDAEEKDDDDQNDEYTEEVKDEDSDDAPGIEATDSSSSPTRSGRHKRSGTVVEMMEVEGAAQRESPLEFILHQSGGTKELLLDIFCSPKMHPLFMSSFDQVKTLQKEDQPEVWKELMARWRLKMK